MDGANHHELFTSGFAGRAFLRAGILVLQFPVRPSTQPATGDRETIALFMDGIRSAVDALVMAGLIDPQRIGVMGWSATGERLLNQITFSDLPIQAVSLLDGDANTSFSSIVTYGFSDNTVARKERTNGGSPVGDSRGAWMRNDPSMHTDSIQAAVRVETYGPWVNGPRGEEGGFGTCYASTDLAVAFCESVIHECAWYLDGSYQIASADLRSRYTVTFRRVDRPELRLADFTGKAVT